MIARRARERLANTLDWRFAWLERQLGERFEARIDDLVRRLDDERARRIAAEDRLDSALAGLDDLVRGQIAGTLRAIAAEEPRNRRELWALRERPDYELAFTEDEPLVSITLATTGTRNELLLERALPSALSQTYENIEVIVSGDAADDATRRAVVAVDDPRVRFVNSTQRVVDPDPHRHWLAAGTMALNEAYRVARGRWLAGLDDDDALKPTAIEDLLARAREQHVEVAYGLIERIAPDGERTLLGSFPPRPLASVDGEPAPPWPVWQGITDCGALAHAGLRIFAREHVAIELGVPGDFFRTERMVRAGVNFAMLDQPVYEYYASLLWEGEPTEQTGPRGGSLSAG